MELGADNNVNITVNQDNSDDATVYKGSVQKATKDCYIIVDFDTNEITIERVSRHIRVKRTRSVAGILSAV